MTISYSKSSVITRAQQFWKKEKIWVNEDNFPFDLKKIEHFLQTEYDNIPQKERIGKGSIFITRATAEGCFPLVKDQPKVDVLKMIRSLFSTGDSTGNRNITNLALLFLAEYAKTSLDAFEKAIEIIKQCGDHDLWEVREVSCYTLRTGLQKYPDQTLAILESWAKSSNENLRRLTAESLRPITGIKWLRNPEMNDPVFAILTILLKDPSKYVRTAVGNNLKDLSKYMPKKVLERSSNWMTKTEIIVTPDLASKTTKELGKEKFALIWTLKHALRWLRKRHPEHHAEIEEILGKNYVLYFDEKGNKRALPK